MTGGLLTLEFTGVDSDRTFAGLIPAPHDGTVHRVDPLARQFENRTALRDQARAVAAAAPPTRLVLAFCSAAALAVEVAAHARDPHGRRPGVVLIDPFVVTDERVGAEFTHLHERLGGAPIANGRTAFPAHGGSSGALSNTSWTDDEAGAVIRPTLDLSTMEGLLADRRPDLVEACGGEEFADAADYLLDRYRAWLRFLTACAEATPTTGTADVTVIGDDIDLTPITTARVRRIACATSPGAPELTAAVARIVTATT